MLLRQDFLQYFGHHGLHFTHVRSESVGALFCLLCLQVEGVVFRFSNGIICSMFHLAFKWGYETPYEEAYCIPTVYIC